MNRATPRILEERGGGGEGEKKKEFEVIAVTSCSRTARSSPTHTDYSLFIVLDALDKFREPNCPFFLFFFFTSVLRSKTNNGF